MNVKELKKRWFALFSNDAHVAAACTFCGRTRAEVTKLIEGPSAYICGECVALCVGILIEDKSDPLAVGVQSLRQVVMALPIEAPYAQIEPLLEAMLRMTLTEESAIAVYHEAARRSHYDLAARALLAIPSEARSQAVWHDIAAMRINLEQFEAAKDALTKLKGREDLFTDCHVALIAAHENAAVEDAVLDDLLARAKKSENVALQCEALEALARHRANKDDVEGALAAIDEAMAKKESASLLLLRGDLLADSDRKGALEAWKKALDRSHADGFDARRARERLERKHPYRAR